VGRVLWGRRREEDKGNERIKEWRRAKDGGGKFFNFKDWIKKGKGYRTTKIYKNKMDWKRIQQKRTERQR
jgi:hypothetical protein